MTHVFHNRECANCTPPCQGGEVLHRRGYCAHGYCLCTGFEPMPLFRGAERGVGKRRVGIVPKESDRS